MECIPVEILAAIFNVTLPPYAGPGHSQERQPRVDYWDAHLINIVLVCRYWKDVAYETPTLWALIHVRPTLSLARTERRLFLAKRAPLYTMGYP